MEQQQVSSLAFHMPCSGDVKHTACFLDLPYNIRERIYNYARLYNNELVWLSGDIWGFGRDEKRVPPLSLLRVCKAVHREVEALLYSRNHFFIGDYETPEALTALSRLSPRACAHLKDLAVRLRFNQYNGSAMWTLGNAGGDYEQSVTDGELVRLWRAAIEHIIPQVTPRRLKLRIACGTSDVDQIKSVLAPLRQYPNQLGSLGIMLGCAYKPELISLIQETVQELTPGPQPPSTPFRFFDLPAEIRWHIYRYTELAMPLGEVQWTPHRGFEAACTSCACYKGLGCGEADTIHYCSENLHCRQQYGSFPCCSTTKSAASSECQHWQSPLPLMLVSRDMNKEATAFFYSHNRFTILSKTRPVQRQGKPPVRYDEPDESAVKQFVDRLARPEAVLRHLRHLEVIYPGLDPRSPEDLQSSTLACRESWLEAVEYLSKYANVPALQLTMHLYRSHVRPLYSEEGRPLPPANDESVFAAYASILEPLRALVDKDIGSLLIHLDWPSNAYASTLPDGKAVVDEYHWMPGVNWEIMKMEGRLGKLIMGERYECQSMRAKATKVPSQTLRCLWDGRKAQR